MEHNCTQLLISRSNEIQLQPEKVHDTDRDEVSLASVLSVFRLLFPKFRSSRILSAEFTCLKGKDDQHITEKERHLVTLLYNSSVHPC